MTETVLQFEHLQKSFDSAPVLKGITAQVHTGEIVGLVGLNGAGKTTLLETALGFSPASAGSAKVFGAESAQLAAPEVKAKIGFVPQQEELLDHINGKRYLALVAAFYTHWNSALVERLCESWSVPLDKKIRSMSVGQRQKLAIISALGHEPALLVLDEPAASLDPVSRRQFLQELVDIVGARDCTVVFSTHIISDLERVASRIWLLKEGELYLDDSLDSLKEKIARISLPKEVVVPSGLLNGHVLQERGNGDTRTMILQNWSEEQHQRLAQRINYPLDSAWWLSLEDIFIEVHGR